MQICRHALFLLLATCIAVHGRKSEYVWEKVGPAGGGCFPPKCRDGQFPMAVRPMVGINGQLLFVGDKTIWSSTEPMAFASRFKTDWEERHGMQPAFFNGRIWMTGGMTGWEDFRNDIWSSADGEIWRRDALAAAWPARRGHSVFVHRGMLWLIGGSISSGQRDKTPIAHHRDVWTSADGVFWKRVLDETPWTPDDAQTAIAFKDRIVVLDSVRGDVWSSANGSTWTKIAAGLPWKERGGHGIAELDGRLWIYGGVERNDVWSSGDGRAWSLEFANAPWSKRSAIYSISWRGKLWLFSGKTGREDSWEGDVWAMSRKPE